ncbi:leucine-rich_repeat domain-containing protein [Hexamita inflata]|uniref:Leucine-rich_repeat domain-containing protein n=1 Tax=Hexamita inflata TaxID=28002 RepID=A0ABP1KHI5_9EUKA
MSEQQSYLVSKLEDLHSKEIEKYVNVSIVNIYFKKLDHIPVHIQVLKINSCSLQSLKNLCNLVDLRYLDIRDNLVNDVTEIVIHQELTYLDITDNCVILIDPIIALKKLKTLLLGNNQIVNLEPLVRHENFDPAWIAPAQLPLEEEDVAQTLTPGSSEHKIAELIKAESKKKEYSDYLQNTIKLAAPLVKGRTLTVNNQTCITSILFSDCLHIDTLCLNNCPNVSFNQLPKKIKHLSVTNSGLTRLNGLEKMTQLESIDLSGNDLIKCEILAQLKLLQTVNLTNNKIIDLKHVKQFIQFQNTFVSQQVKPEISDCKKYLGPEGTDSQVQQLIVEMNENTESNEQIIYDSVIIQKYKDKVVNGVLEIKKDQNLTSTEFSSLIGNLNQNKVVDLRIISCKNLKLDRCPKSSITSLTINKCNLKDINGIQTMTQLTQLNLSLNQISDISQLAPLTNLTSLDLGQNNIECISVLSSFKQLISLDVSENLINDLSSLRDLLQLQIVDVSYNKIQSISDLVALSNIKRLNITQTNTCSLDSLAKMTKMTHLLMSSNRIISIQILKSFPELQDLRLENNFIQDFEPIAKHKFANKNWIREQNVPTEADFMNSFNCNKYEVTQLINKSKQKKEMSDNKYMLIKKYENDAKNAGLKISGEKQLNNLQFTDVLKLTELEAMNSQTVHFAEDQVPTLLLKLKLNNCTFKDHHANLNPITGIYQMEQLVELDLAFNKIRDVSEIGNLTNLKKLYLQNNDIHRINELRNLAKLTHVNLSNNKVIFSEPLNQLNVEVLIDNNIVTDNIQLKNQQKPQLVNYKNFLGPNSTDDQVNELSTIIPFDYNYNLQMTQKYKNLVENSELSLVNDPTITDFCFTSEIKATVLTIQNCKNVKLPSQNNVKHFKTNNGGLKDFVEVKLVKVPSQITSLTINQCQLTNVVGIENMKQLTYLNLKDNKIILIEPVKQLTNLKQLIIDNNFIHDLESITAHNNYSLEWIAFQNTPTDADIQNYLKDTNSTPSLNEFKIILINKKVKTDQIIVQYENKNDYDLRTKYQSQIQNGILTINGDSTVKDIQFVDELPIVNLILTNCFNVSLRRTPTKILSLTINNSKLTNLVGIEQMKQLQYADLRDNCIISVEPLKHLIHLKQLLIDNNFIQDLEYITQLPNYTSDWIYYQRDPSDADIQTFIQSQSNNKTLQELKQNKQKTNELIQLYPAKYDNEMITKYQNKIDKKGCGYGPYLQIQNDLNIRDLSFTEKLNITNLDFIGCKNAHLLRAPKNLRVFVNNNSNLNTLKGIERLTQLELLAIENCNIVNINQLQGLSNIKILNIQGNKIIDLSVVKQLKQQGLYQQSYEIADQIQPTQMEIQESKLW